MRFQIFIIFAAHKIGWLCVASGGTLDCVNVWCEQKKERKKTVQSAVFNVLVIPSSDC